MSIVAILLLIASAFLIRGSDEPTDSPRTLTSWNEHRSSERGAEPSVAVPGNTLEHFPEGPVPQRGMTYQERSTRTAA
jgi:hypothetical protein